MNTILTKSKRYVLPYFKGAVLIFLACCQKPNDQPKEPTKDLKIRYEIYCNSQNGYSKYYFPASESISLKTDAITQYHKTISFDWTYSPNQYWQLTLSNTSQVDTNKLKIELYLDNKLFKSDSINGIANWEVQASGTYKR